MNQYEDYLGLGIAGNFALHLAQAGELEEFKHIKTQEESSPKGMFAFYLPSPKINMGQKKQLSIYPFSSSKINLPTKKLNIQAEPEVGLVCNLEYENEKLIKIKPIKFGAYNDCSIRIAGAKKISDKKNWGANSKGLSDNLIDIDKFESGSIMDSYSICSFLKRDEEFFAYGEDVELNGYSYFYEKLNRWMINQINSQTDIDPLEDLSLYMKSCEFPKKAIISIGATRYTPYGEKTFLKSGDEIFVILYNRNYGLNTLDTLLNTKREDISLLAQRVI